MKTPAPSYGATFGRFTPSLRTYLGASYIVCVFEIRSSLGSSSDGWWLAAVVLSALTAWASGRPPGLRRSVRLARRWECESTQVAVVCTSSFDRSVLKSFLVVRDETGGWTRVS